MRRAGISKLKPRERDAIVQALRAGVVPKLGLRHIQVVHGREAEKNYQGFGPAIKWILGEPHFRRGATFVLSNKID
ncbi:BREX system ATP-binding domain-containing protein [Rhodovulum bhavnagarense]|uniref:BREX system ATP-binding domain-containing protein n=1 Tax=Rhodovulum bhavnagarense TaxID=992286 RepID=UPI001FB81538|nr:BREX system ATP-binding domain-containing protein [Rhodovulum bhavnagarense]